MDIQKKIPFLDEQIANITEFNAKDENHRMALVEYTVLADGVLEVKTSYEWGEAPKTKDGLPERYWNPHYRFDYYSDTNWSTMAELNIEENDFRGTGLRGDVSWGSGGTEAVHSQSKKAKNMEAIMRQIQVRLAEFDLSDQAVLTEDSPEALYAVNELLEWLSDSTRTHQVHDILPYLDLQKLVDNFGPEED